MWRCRCRVRAHGHGVKLTGRENSLAEVVVAVADGETCTRAHRLGLHEIEAAVVLVWLVTLVTGSDEQPTRREPEPEAWMVQCAVCSVERDGDDGSTVD